MQEEITIRSRGGLDRCRPPYMYVVQIRELSKVQCAMKMKQLPLILHATFAFKP